MNIPETLRYCPTHEWVRQEADGTVTVGISDFAQDNLGELVYVELPRVGRQVSSGESCAVVESVKAASDVYAPLPGEIVATNAALVDTPNRINGDPYGAWLFKLKLAAGADVGELMDAAAYAKIASIM